MEEFSMHFNSTTRTEMKPPTSYSNNHKQLLIHPKYENIKRTNQIQNNPSGKHVKKAYINILNVN